MTTSYPTERRRVKKWYKKHFMHFINIACFDAHVVYKKEGGKLEPYRFRELLVEQIISKYGCNESSGIQRKGGRPSIEGNPFRLTERHFLMVIPPTEGKENPTKRCTVCLKHKTRHETRYQCRQCNVPLCVVPCFEVYHTQKHF